MRFFVPEWDDAVDANYDFVHDELSILEKSSRTRDYIWDIFDQESTPIDGVLISREQVEGNDTKCDRLTTHGVYDDPVLSIPEWLPTISDCGAWGYKALPFPPYSNEGMLEFYESLDVDVGVTIDHLVLGNGAEADRLYLDERWFDSEFGIDDIPDTVTEEVEIMASEWPKTWPGFVNDHDPTITNVGDQSSFRAADFDGPWEAVRERLNDDPRVVVRANDNAFRYDLTLENAREMRQLYEEGEYSFRLMAAFQGWSAKTYADAVGEILDMGYQYVGIGGVAGSSVETVRRIVEEVGRTVTAFQREHETRVDAHVFGFAKTDAFDTVGRAGMTSFDSASMLRAAWTGGDNYHLTADDRYDAIRVRYPPAGASVDVAIEVALWAQEVLAALRAYDATEPILPAIETQHTKARRSLESLPEYLQKHRHDDRFDKPRLREIRSAFREQYEHGRPLLGSFGKGFRRELVRMLRSDDPEDPVPFEEYEELITTAADILETFPRTVDDLQGRLDRLDSFQQVCFVVEAYVGTDHIDDRNLLDEYRTTLQARPWEECECPICKDLGIDVAIFRGNNRNRRRGFHNTRRFYDEFERALPKVFILAPADSSIMGASDVESYLQSTVPGVWENVHDLPIAEIGVYDANGIHEWWEPSPDSISRDPRGIQETLASITNRYESVYIADAEAGSRPTDLPEGVTVIDSPVELRRQLLAEFGYGDLHRENIAKQSGLEEF